MDRILSGQFEVTIDDTGRINLPRRLRFLENDKVIITKGADPCLWMYIAEDWKDELKKIVELTNPYSAQDRDIRRRFIGPAHETEVDKQGRILISSHLREFAGLSKDCLIVGLYNYIEIWEPNKYKAYQVSEDEIIKRTEDFSGRMKGSIEDVRNNAYSGFAGRDNPVFGAERKE